MFEQEFYLEIRIKTEIWEEVVLYIMLLVSVDITYMCLKTWFLFKTNHKRYKEILNTEYSLKKYSLHCILNSPQPFHPACKAETEIQEEKDGSQTDRKRTNEIFFPFIRPFSILLLSVSYHFAILSFLGLQLRRATRLCERSECTIFDNFCTINSSSLLVKERSQYIKNSWKKHNI